MTLAAAVDPSGTRFRIALQPSASVGLFDHAGGSNWHQHRGRPPEAFTTAHEPIADDSFNPGGQQTPPGHGILRPGGAINALLEPEGLALYMALIQRGGATPVDLEGAAAWEHKLDPAQTDVDFFGRCLQGQIYRGDAAVENFWDAGVQQLAFNFATGANAQMTATLVGARADYWGPPTQTVGTSTNPYIRGVPDYSTIWGVDAVTLLDIEVTAVPGAGGNDFDITVTREGDVAGATVVPITVGNDAAGRPIWNRVVLSTTGAGAGKRPSEVELHWPDATGVIVTDHWTIAKGVATPWAASLPTIRKFSTAECEVFIDGTKDPHGLIRTLQLQIAHTAERDEGLGDVWAGGVIVSGTRQVTGSVEKRMVDNDLQRRLEAFEPIHLDVRCTSPVLIPTTSIEYYQRFVAPQVTLNGERPTATDPNTQAESYNLVCNQPDAADAEGFDADLSIVLRNGLADLSLPA